MGLCGLNIPVAHNTLTDFNSIKGGVTVPNMVVSLSPGVEHSPTGGGLVAAPGLVALVAGIILPIVDGVWDVLVANKCHSLVTEMYICGPGQVGTLLILRGFSHCCLLILGGAVCFNGMEADWGLEEVLPLAPQSQGGAAVPELVEPGLEVAVAGAKWAMPLPRPDAGTSGLGFMGIWCPALIWAEEMAAFKWACGFFWMLPCPRSFKEETVAIEGESPPATSLEGAWMGCSNSTLADC